MPEMLFKVPGSWSASAHVDDTKYREMYAKSVRDPEGFTARTTTACAL
jgi:acetyl-CoA synthetase